MNRFNTFQYYICVYREYLNIFNKIGVPSGNRGKLGNPQTKWRFTEKIGNFPARFEEHRRGSRFSFCEITARRTQIYLATGFDFSMAAAFFSKELGGS
jgi:hypothetical protein